MQAEATLPLSHHNVFQEEQVVVLECSICYDDALEAPLSIIHGCNHVYHSHCIESWLRSNGTTSNAKCPQCNSNFDLKDLEKIYPNTRMENTYTGVPLQNKTFKKPDVPPSTSPVDDESFFTSKDAALLVGGVGVGVTATVAVLKHKLVREKAAKVVAGAARLAAGVGLSPGLIAAAAVGCAAVGVAAIVGVMYYKHRQRSRAQLQ